MTDKIAIPPHETGAVRVFALPDADTAQRLKNATEMGQAAVLAKALGAEGIDSEFVDVFLRADLAPLSLSAYLAEGLGVAPEALGPERSRLDALDFAIIVLSRAVAGRSKALNPPFNLIATLHEDRTPVRFEPLPDAGTGATPAPSPPAPGSKRAPSALIVGAALIAAAVLVLLLWPRA